MWRRISLVFAGLTLTACAASTPNTRPFIAGAGREVLTAAEIVAARVTDVYQAVTQLRPEFLRRRPAAMPYTPSTIANVIVYVDEMPFGSMEALRYIPLDRVRLIRYVRPNEANLKYGGSHPGGAIIVTTLKPR
ncbi:MAG TPA: hypothetical protein VEB19_17955 [Gemmatimonadaceae bacterium]|nr:hypothetical protein [Gemmatimonadaceae bacterium]